MLVSNASCLLSGCHYKSPLFRMLKVAGWMTDKWELLQTCVHCKYLNMCYINGNFVPSVEITTFNGS